MQAVNCPRCGRVFTKIKAPVCKNCEKEEEQTFELVREYIKENPDCTMSELVDETHVSAKRITQYIRDGRLEISKGMKGEIVCSKCGKPIPSGRFCEKCILEVKFAVDEMKKKDAGGSRMYTKS